MPKANATRNWARSALLGYPPVKLCKLLYRKGMAITVRAIEERQLVLGTSCFGPRLPTWALQQVGSYLGYTGHQINVVVVTAARGPRSVQSRLTLTEPRRWVGSDAAPPTRQNLCAEVLGVDGRDKPAMTHFRSGVT
jgi:hypothetical protein